MEIDHIFICTKSKVLDGDMLVKFGLIEGSSNTHPGQGTTNRRFYFCNMMLELLCVDNIDEACSECTKPMRLYERWLATSDRISPFGIGLRPTTEKDDLAPFPVWDYHPKYLPDSLKIQVANNTPLSEPMYFYLFFARRNQSTDKTKEMINHKVPLNKVTFVKVYINHDSKLSETAIKLNKSDGMLVIQDKENLLEIEFDNGMSNQAKDFRPFIPLVFKW